MKCVCIQASRWYNIVESQNFGGGSSGAYEFIPGEVYEVVIERDGFWGDYYVVKNPPHQTSFGVKDHENTPPGRAFSDFFRIIS